MNETSYTLKVACIFLIILAFYMGLAITGLAYENIQMRQSLAKCGAISKQ